jgi:hypothetical protein
MNNVSAKSDGEIIIIDNYINIVRMDHTDYNDYMGEYDTINSISKIRKINTDCKYTNNISKNRKIYSQF